MMRWTHTQCDQTNTGSRANKKCTAAAAVVQHKKRKKWRIWLWDLGDVVGQQRNEKRKMRRQMLLLLLLLFDLKWSRQKTRQDNNSSASKQKTTATESSSWWSGDKTAIPSLITELFVWKECPSSITNKKKRGRRRRRKLRLKKWPLQIKRARQCATTASIDSDKTRRK